MEPRVAIVTGAGRGIGRAEAIALAAQGYRVVLNDLPSSGRQPDGGEDAVASVLREVEALGGTGLIHLGDVGSPDDANEMVQLAVERFGRLDVLVNNAGNQPRMRVLPDMTLKEIDATFNAHVRGTFCTSIAATRHWRDEARRAGKPVNACIVNTASEAFLFGSPWRLDYAAAKSAIVTLTIGSAITGAGFGVRVNAVCPRAATRMTQEGAFAIPADDPLNSPASVAAVVVALCGEAARRVNGQVLVAGGGVLRVLAGPTVDAELASDGEWDLEDVERVLEGHFGGEARSYGSPLGPAAALLDDLRGDFDLFGDSGG